MKKVIVIFMVLLIGGIIGGTIYMQKNREEKLIEENKNSKIKEENNTDKEAKFWLNLLKDKNYKEIDIQEKRVQDAYQMPMIRSKVAEIPPFYKEEMFSNDAIIAITLEQGVKYEEVKIFDETLGDYKTIYVYDPVDFARKAKEIWGENVTYHMEQFKGISHCESYVYDEERKTILLEFGTGCGSQEEINRELVFAYETEEKLVLVEKSFYVLKVETDTKKTGIYNNIKDKKLLHAFTEKELTQYITQQDKNKIIHPYEEFATYYSYTFEKTKTDQLILSTFDRLN